MVKGNMVRAGSSVSVEDEGSWQEGAARSDWLKECACWVKLAAAGKEKSIRNTPNPLASAHQTVTDGHSSTVGFIVPQDIPPPKTSALTQRFYYPKPNWDSKRATDCDLTMSNSGPSSSKHINSQ
jgi:hypothetical protein